MSGSKLPFLFHSPICLSMSNYHLILITRASLLVSCGIFCRTAFAVLVVQLLSRVSLFVTAWTVSCQAFLSITISQSLLKLMSIMSMSSNHPLWPPSPSAFNLSQRRGLFQWVCSLHQVTKVLELQLQHLLFLGLCIFIQVLQPVCNLVLKQWQYKPQPCCSFEWDSLNLDNNLERNDTFTIPRPSIYEHGVLFCVFDL